VVVFGLVEIIEDENNAEAILQKLLEKYAPHLKPSQDYKPIQTIELKITAVYKILIEEWTGKKQEETENYPGAFSYPVGIADE
ncbi:MAG: hypothetical protein P8Y72_13875, partial [Anaerolineales bacterium]